MIEFVQTGEGRVPEEWIDANGHMNVVHYMALFDKGSDVLCRSLGITPESIASGGRTLVASRILIHHRKELMRGESWALKSCLVQVKPDFLTFSHRLVSGAIRATCDIRAAVFCPLERCASKLSQEQIRLAQDLVVPGLVDKFETQI